MTKRTNPAGGVLRRTVLKATAITVGSLAVSSPVSGSDNEKDETESDESGTICGDVDDIVSHTVTGGGGIDIHVDETGNDEGRPILFAHGFSGSRLVWDEQLHSDLRDDFRLVAFDFRGHGLSDKPDDEGAYTDPERWAADTQAVIDELGLDDPVLVSWSVGSEWIADYLLVNGEDDIAGVNLVGPRIELQDEDPTAVFAEGMLGLLGSSVFASTDVEESMTGLEQFVSLWTADPLPPKDHALLFGTVSMVPPYVRAGIMAREIVHDELLAGLESPVLISHGELDEIMLPAGTETFATIIPNARTSFYPGVGHMPYLEEPTRFNRELREFVTAL